MKSMHTLYYWTLLSFTFFCSKREHLSIYQMGSPQENFDKGVELRLAGNEAFKKQNFKDGKKINALPENN